MAVLKAEKKTVLLLSPHLLLKDHSMLVSLHITKSGAGIEYKQEEFTHSELRAHYPHSPKEVKDVLACFNTDGYRLIKEEIKKKFTAQRSGIAFDIYYRNAFTRRVHELFERLKPFAVLLKWYHKLPADKGHYRSGPCTFTTARPYLQFDVAAEDEALQLNTWVVLDGTPYPLQAFGRYQFLLHKANEYFLLSYKDYQTLEWLYESNPAQYSHQPQELARNILTRLEADYSVNRNNLFAKNEIQAAPVNRVLLSEISQSFLVLTPQWLYDGFLVDGNFKPAVEVVQNGVEYSIQRNKEAETAFVQLLESLHPNFGRQLNGYYYLSFEEAQKKQWFLKVYHKLLDLDIQVIGMDMLQEAQDILTLKLSVFFGKEEIPLAELQKILQAGQRTVFLKDGSLGILDDGWQQQYAAVLRHGKIKADGSIQVPRWLAFSEQQSTEDTQVLKPVIHKSWWQKWEQWQHTDQLVHQQPASLQATLRPYQQKGFEWMALLAEAGAGACLADDMGLGKTLQTICFLSHWKAQQTNGKYLIICPSSLIYNWQQELAKFAPSLKVYVYHGAGRDETALTSNEYAVIITSYGTVRADAERMSAIEFSVAVLDESHNIKNPASQITRAVNQLQAGFRIALSGTPVMNNTFDLYAQLNFLLPGLFGSREFFKREYADAIDRNKDADKIRALQQITAPFILRRTKEQVAPELPAKTEMVLWCDMSTAQKDLYDSIKSSIRNSVFLDIKEQGLNKSKMALLAGIQKLRQICNSPLLLPDEERTCTDSVKTELLIDELTNNLSNHKVLVFSQFTGMLDLLAERLTQQGIAYYHFDGQTPPAKRIEMVDAFQEAGNTVPVFLISLKAGNAGLNLTAADYVFLVDPWWNTAVQQQAIDRTHRIGQTKNVFAYKMICRDTIEEKIIDLQLRKKQLADDLVAAEDGFVKSLTEDDIAYLFS
jgi:superfamily II DNA or RNA helicase